MIAKWIGIRLLDVEITMKRIKNYKKLKLLEKALIDYVNINCKKFSFENKNSSNSTKVELLPIT